MRVLGVGQCTLDFIGVIDRFVEPDSQIELDQFSIQGGGPAATAMVVLARWGEQAAFVGKVGTDSRGDEIIATLSGEGVEVGEMLRDEGAISPSCFIFVEEKSSQKKVYYTQGNISGLAPEELPASLLDGIDLLLVDGTQPEAQASLMAQARQRGVMTMLDADRRLLRLDPLIEHADIVVASERYISQMTGEGTLERMAHALLERGPSRVVITLGNEGSVAMDAHSQALVREAAYDVEVFDTTGVGDVFHGALVYSTLKRWPLDYALRFGNTVAGLACTSLGGRSRIASLDELYGIIGQPPLSAEA